MWRCFGKCWKAVKSFTTNETTQKYYGKHWQSFKPWKIQRNRMGKQGLLMRGCLVKCWKALTSIKTIEYTKNAYGNARFLNAGMLGEMLESMEILSNRLKHNKTTYGK